MVTVLVNLSVNLRVLRGDGRERSPVEFVVHWTREAQHANSSSTLRVVTRIIATEKKRGPHNLCLPRGLRGLLITFVRTSVPQP